MSGDALALVVDTPSVTADDIRRKLRTEQKRQERAEAQRDRAVAAQRTLLVEVQKTPGISMTEAAGILKLSRRRAYQLMDDGSVKTDART